MDRKNEEIEEANKQTSSISASTPPTIKNTTNFSTTSTDDDTSIESCDTFGSWTLVNDSEQANRIEILKNIDNDKEDRKKESEECKTEEEPQDSPNDISNDDFSDGVSIISENESVGRISPNPYIRDHLHDLNIKFCLSDHMDDTILNKMREDMENETVPLLVKQSASPEADRQIRQRRKSSTATANAENRALETSSQTLAISSGFVPLVKRGFQGIFYVGVGLAILCLIGKIKMAWEPLTSVVNSPSTAELEQKVNDMELQNNLMRAEIDLINKQVKYLSSVNTPKQPKLDKYKDYKQSKTFKAWSGNGDTLKPIDITKQDLRKPYKCPDGSFVEIANMCIEQKQANEPSIVDQFSHVMEDLKEKSEAYKTFEKVAEELQDIQDNPFEYLQDIFGEEVNAETPTKQSIKNKPIIETLQDNKENAPYSDKYLKKHWRNGEDTNFSAKQNKYAKVENKNDENSKAANKEYKKTFVKDEYKENLGEYKKYHEHDNSQENNQWKADKFGNNSKEKKYRKDNSKERNTKDFDDSKETSKENKSKERYNKQKRKYDDYSGEWHDKYMKHREEQRKHNEQPYPNNRNWYINRGDSRENKRSGEKRFR